MSKHLKYKQRGEYMGAKYTGIDPIRMPDGSLLVAGEVTELLSPEAASNDNNFYPIYGDYNENTDKVEGKDHKDQNVKIKANRKPKKNPVPQQI